MPNHLVFLRQASFSDLWKNNIFLDDIIALNAKCDLRNVFHTEAINVPQLSPWISIFPLTFLSKLSSPLRVSRVGSLRTYQSSYWQDGTPFAFCPQGDNALLSNTTSFLFERSVPVTLSHFIFQRYPPSTLSLPFFHRALFLTRKPQWFV